MLSIQAALARSLEFRLRCFNFLFCSLAFCSWAECDFFGEDEKPVFARFFGYLTSINLTAAVVMGVISGLVLKTFLPHVR